MKKGNSLADGFYQNTPEQSGCERPQREEQHLGVTATDGEETEGAERHFRPGEDPARGAERPGTSRTPGVLWGCCIWEGYKLNLIIFQSKFGVKWRFECV